MITRDLQSADAGALERLLARIPEEDRGFLKEDLSEPDILRRWLDDRRGVRLVGVAGDGELMALAAAWPGVGRSRHVGDVRLVVAPEHRRVGLGQRLARELLVRSLHRGLAKLCVEVVAEHQGTIAMFLEIGFEPEAILRDHLRDRDGALHDIVVLSHIAADAASTVVLVGPEQDGAW